MPPDSSDTKRRIFSAACTEFARYGLAGARVDRIAEEARANKRSIYVHFGPKEQLFDLVVSQALMEMADDVPFTAEDLPSYAGDLFDYLISRPEILRLTSWAGLERTDASPEELQAYEPKIRALSELFDDAAVDVLTLLLGQITAWQYASAALRAHATGDPRSESRLKQHRALLVASARALVDVAKTSAPAPD